MKCICFSILIAGILTSTVSAQLTAYSDKKHVHILADKTTLSIRDSSVSLLEPNQSGVATVAGVVLPPAIDYVASAVEAGAAGNTKKFQATYSCSASCDHFYADASEAMLPNVTIRRWIKDKKGNDLLAASVRLVPELSSDRTAFRFMARDSFIYNYSMAKTTGPYDYLHLQLTINVKSVSVQEEVYKVANLRTTIMDIPMVHVGHTCTLDEAVYSGWIPLPPPSTVKVAVEPLTSKKSEVTDKWVNEVKKETQKTETSVTNHTVYAFRPVSGNTGLYEIEVSVTESNPFKTRAEARHAFLEKTDDQTSDALKAALKSTTENN